MHILGINAYHAGASACLIEDGVIVCAVEEERLNRKKYWAGFPTESIRYCLADGGIDVADLDHIAISRDPSANLVRKGLWALRNRPRIGYLTDRWINRARVKRFDRTFCDELGFERTKVRAEFHHVEHHRAHMASAFFVSPFERAAILSVDGMGDFVSTMWGLGDGNSFDVRGKVHYPHSLGFFYTAVSQWLGFTGFGDEGKVMGLASYGEPRFSAELGDLVDVEADGSFRLNLEYFAHSTRGIEMTWAAGSPEISTLYSAKFTTRFGPARQHGSPIEPIHTDMAASLQRVLENRLEALLRRVHTDTGCETLCLAGGVALNGVFNGKIRERTPFREIYIQPAAGDAGTALGAAFYVWNQNLGRGRGFHMQHAYIGAHYAEVAIEEALWNAGLRYARMPQDDLVRAAAQLISEGNVVGWFQGRMEWGPRALGNRSILADPRRAEMREVLNARIKHREAFRPFAPSVLEAAMPKYFEDAAPDPFMLTVYPVRPEKRSEVPAITHVDGSGRLQTVSQTTNPLYFDLLTELERLTGVPMVLNTSFNENEPIVCSPEDAIDCFSRTRMDALAIGSFLVRR